MLTGVELLAKVKELGDAPKDKVCEACGYISKAGKPAYTAFYEALIEAKGVTLAPPSTAKKPKKGKPLSFTAKVAKSGTVPITAGYTALIGAGPEDRIKIGFEGGRLWLEKLDADPVVVTEAPVVVATDDTEELTITAPAAPEAVRELAPF